MVGAAEMDARDLPDLRALRPERYVTREMLWTGEPVTAFRADEPADFDWLERMILAHGYYERDGIWTPDLNHDKQALAEIVAAFAPRRALELGCGSGPVLEYLRRTGVAAEGVEISRMAIARAPRGVRDRIHHGDLLALDLAGGFDVVVGLDVFEHLNPTRLDAYLARVHALLADGGHVFANIPAFGDDPVFGLVFPVYLRDWYEDLYHERPFRLVHVDDRGYPMNGHLVWADSRWWVARFERHGLRREPDVERAIHARYDQFFDRYAAARKAFYVFSRDGREADRARVIARARDTGSEAIRDWYARAPAAGAPAGPAGAELLASEHVFFKGWYAVEPGPNGPFRWSQGRALLELVGAAGRVLRLVLFTDCPTVTTSPVTARVLRHPGGPELRRVTLRSRQPVAVEIPVPDDEVVLELAVDPTWIPRLTVEGSGDERELGVGVRAVRLLAPPARGLATRIRRRLPAWLRRLAP
jgi:SAM-dependent methyltransferase